jgi:hypothetical protein
MGSKSGIITHGDRTAVAYRRTDLSRLRGRGVRTRTGRERPGLMDGGLVPFAVWALTRRSEGQLC